MRKGNKLLWAALLLVAASFTDSCSRRPKEVLSDEEAASLLADLHIAESYSVLGTNGPGIGSMMVSEQDSVNKVLRQSVLQEHEVTEAQLDTTLSWYGHNLDKYEEMYELVMEKIAEKQKDLSGSDDESKALPTLWPYGNMQRIAGGKNTAAVVPFEVAGDKIAKGGRIVWEGKLINNRGPLEMYMSVEYEDGSIGYINRTFPGSGRQNISLQTDSSMKVKKLLGYLRVSQSQPLLLDSVSLRVTPLSPNNYYEIHSVRTIR
ncbi:MAG: DUF4296 domain-containing protein [Prevotella sp.]|nr:DUF4296 domain-containing protein [Prevotella sp.]MCM1075544.1 DUF4296 domain-containing protein [Ruminococcus sp.]